MTRPRSIFIPAAFSPTRRTMQLLDLLLETLVAISNKLTFTDILSYIAGVQGNPGFNLSTGARLEVLIEIERLWACLEYTFKKKLKVPQLPSGAYDAAGSVFAGVFCHRPEDAIIIFALSINNDSSGMMTQSFSMIVHRKSPLARIPDTTQPCTVRAKFWEEWGPPITRWFVQDFFSTTLITTTTGHRYVRLIFPEEAGAVIVVLDSNPNHVRLAKVRGLDNERTFIVGMKEEDNSVEKCFYDAVSMDEQRIDGPNVCCAHSFPIASGDTLVPTALLQTPWKFFTLGLRLVRRALH
ncbi:hypothetical protein K443DRAFT_14239 [Laccaria amethystina LaAM-08-1]|uniref:Uncharacterized protein n=1 Tax=Laccaria amethystina LaAM-08-1 TaxID=1095629 RepID=A0A0C9X1V9_9AGAR|nr:hypothetical protein K443DRAFT_14239 [Laccaria amethystina LaAM-08-1]